MFTYRTCVILFRGNYTNSWQARSHTGKMLMDFSDICMRGVLLKAGPRPSSPRLTACGPRHTSQPKARRPGGPRPKAQGPKHTSRPAAWRPASQFTSRGPVQDFGQRYFTAHVLICVPKWKKVSFGFFAISIVSIPCNPCIFLLLFAQRTNVRGLLYTCVYATVMYLRTYMYT